MSLKVIIPAAGYATRLYPLTVDKPKHMLEIAGKPIIDHILSRVQVLSPDSIHIVTNDRFYKTFKSWSDIVDYPNLFIHNDGTGSNQDRLGQVGDIQFVIDKANISDDLLIIAGDNLFNFSLLPSFERFQKSQYVLNAVYDIKSKPLASHMGVVVLDSAGKITKFWEKPENPKSTLVSLGIYYFPKSHIKKIREYIESGESPDKMGDFMEWLLAHDKVIAHVYHDLWFDIGVPEALDDAQKKFKPL